MIYLAQILGKIKSLTLKSVTFPLTILPLLALPLIASCSSPTLDDYQQTTPVFAFDSFFDGDLIAYGIVFNRNGNMTRRFHVELSASWQGEQGTIKEWFTFDDGEKSTRIWNITKKSANLYEGTASDVIGIAKGRTQGAALHWQYELMINVDGSDYEVALDDWMYLLDEKRLFNKTDIVKFGVKVGEINLVIEKIN
ncbi:DUF3833 domain-containing protein [Moritella marina ATCC 15381]|uniref:DUF3833 domain-containing protein n=1 Tax=Moritella marina ATCC 15381 TaxID=1202962 RepID=A0A5J6WID9_MORMI|nr:DUF3833 domain-containing protein [Moritella marina]QFI36941.1 DUF3833 domain-containing protein [Moritella marina ATCC 15381]